MKKRIVLLGPPASGKGTQADMIRSRLNIPSISPGSVLREELRAGTALGREAAEFTHRGQLAPDSVVVGVIRAWLERNNGKFLFDGFPRSIGQAVALEGILEERHTPLDVALLFDISPEAIRERVERRLVCEKCERIFSSGFHVVNAGEPCPECGGRLVRRADDTLETLRLRMEEYEAQTAPLIPYYAGKGLLARINAEQGPEEVFECVRQTLEAA